MAQNDTKIDLTIYDTVIVSFSGGKDSLASFLECLEQGVPASKIEIWHQDIDGREGSTLMDWGCTADYCRKFAQAFGVPIYFGWKMGGFEREMLRENSNTAPKMFETPDGIVQSGGTRESPGTRLKFPQAGADLGTRWCSAYLKIDVFSAQLSAQKRFNGKKVLVVTGERAEESAGRSKYNEFEVHRTDARDGRLKRHVDAWRPVHKWSEKEVWDVIQKYRVNPHPAYRLGWGRVSCAACIFGSANQWASLLKIDPERVMAIAAYEQKFGKTIDRSKKKLNSLEKAKAGTPYDTMTEVDVKAAMAREFTEPMILAEGTWKLPAGAFGESCGPV